MSAGVTNVPLGPRPGPYPPLCWGYPPGSCPEDPGGPVPPRPGRVAERGGGDDGAARAAGQQVLRLAAQAVRPDHVAQQAHRRLRAQGAEEGDQS